MLGRNFQEFRHKKKFGHSLCIKLLWRNIQTFVHTGIAHIQSFSSEISTLFLLSRKIAPPHFHDSECYGRSYGNERSFCVGNIRISNWLVLSAFFFQWPQKLGREQSTLKGRVCCQTTMIYNILFQQQQQQNFHHMFPLIIFNA